MVVTLGVKIAMQMPMLQRGYVVQKYWQLEINMQIMHHLRDNAMPAGHVQRIPFVSLSDWKVRSLKQNFNII